VSAGDDGIDDAADNCDDHDIFDAMFVIILCDLGCQYTVCCALEIEGGYLRPAAAEMIRLLFIWQRTENICLVLLPFSLLLMLSIVLVSAIINLLVPCFSLAIEAAAPFPRTT
jgi:hypothetical protein